MNLYFKCFCFLFVLVFFFSNCSQETKKKPPKDNKHQSPNIIFIMTDDHAKQAMSCYGSKMIETPNMDRLAEEGVLFNNAFVTNSICGPSRAVALTGKYSHINGLRDNRDKFDGSQPTLPKYLKEAGYQTMVVGKWHLRTRPTGFDYWNVLIDQGEYYSPTMVEMGDTIDHDGYTTTVITDLVMEQLGKRDRKKPFFMMYHQKAPHRNWMPDIKHLNLFEEDIPLPETFYDDYTNRLAAATQDMRIEDMYMSMDMKIDPSVMKEETGTGGNKNFDALKAWQSMYNRMSEAQKKAWDAYYQPLTDAFYEANLKGNELVEWKYQRYIKDYLKCIVSVDENLGRLLDYLEEEKLLDNTIIVYTSDQGFFLGEHGWYDKRFMYEESLGTPLIIRYPGAFKGGVTTDAMVLNLDFAPTLLDYAGVAIPDDMQGRSLRPVLESSGEAPKGWREAIYYHYYEYPHGWHSVKKHYGVRTKTHKLIHFYHDIDTWELFDLKKDPKEVDNVYDDAGYAVVQQDLHARLNTLMKKYKDSPGK